VRVCRFCVRVRVRACVHCGCVPTAGPSVTLRCRNKLEHRSIEEIHSFAQGFIYHMSKIVPESEELSEFALMCEEFLAMDPDTCKACRPHAPSTRAVRTRCPHAPSTRAVHTRRPHAPSTRAVHMRRPNAPSTRAAGVL
jgi:hypothetical protein